MDDSITGFTIFLDGDGMPEEVLALGRHEGEYMSLLADLRQTVIRVYRNTYSPQERIEAEKSFAAKMDALAFHAKAAGFPAPSIMDIIG